MEQTKTDSLKEDQERSEPREYFEDRHQAARLLAEKLKAYRGQNALVLAVPREAVTMAREIADQIEGELELLNEAKDPAQRTLLLVDDGIVEGKVMLETIREMVAKQARQVVVVTPVVTAKAEGQFVREGADVCSLKNLREAPTGEDEKDGTYVDQFYRASSRVSDEDVQAALHQGLRSLPPNVHPMHPTRRHLYIEINEHKISAHLCAPEAASGLVLILRHQTGVAAELCVQKLSRTLEDAHIASLIVDLSAQKEDDAHIDRLLSGITSWLDEQTWSSWARSIPMGVYAEGYMARAALRIAADPDGSDKRLQAIVLREPNLAVGGQSQTESALDQTIETVHLATLLVERGSRQEGLVMSRRALRKLSGEKRLQITDLSFDPAEGDVADAERPMNETVAELATSWFRKHLGRALQLQTSQAAYAHSRN